MQAGYIELVDAGDPLAGDGGEHVGKIKFKAWLGPEFIDDPETDEAGVDRVLGALSAPDFRHPRSQAMYQGIPRTREQRRRS